MNIAVINNGRSTTTFDQFPAELRQLKQWVCWRLETDTNGRQTKIPYTPSGRKASTTDPQQWATYAEALEAYRAGGFTGIGFVFAEGNGITGIDLDHHRNAETGELDAFAQKVLAEFNTYAEVSQSGTGVHLIARGVIPSDRGKRNAKLGVEAYSWDRFFVVTGDKLPEAPPTVEPRQRQICGLVAEVFAKPEPKAPEPQRNGNHAPLPLVDSKLISMASRSRNGSKFAALYRGDWQGAGYGSQSEADAALLGSLRFWTGGDRERSFRLFEQSGLNRDKWNRADYREATWKKIDSGEVFTPGRNGSEPRATEPEQEATREPLKARPLGDLQVDVRSDPDELLKHRFLCRGGGLLLPGPTGIGKSSLVMQMLLRWAIGEAVFGIEPRRPLRSLYIQAENDDGDLVEIRDGVLAGMEFTPTDREHALENVLVHCEDIHTGMGFFVNVVEPLLQLHRPDLLVIDPVFSFLGSDTSQKEVTPWLRNMLNPLLRKYRCGNILIHHTNKPPTGKEKANWQAGDFAYAGSGSIEFANWARAVLALRSIGRHDVYELMAAKRGARLGWTTPEGERVFARLIAHSKKGICWVEPEPEEQPEIPGRKKEHTKEKVALVLEDGELTTTEWLKKADEEEGIGKSTFYKLKNEAISAGLVKKSQITKKWFKTA